MRVALSVATIFLAAVANASADAPPNPSALPLGPDSIVTDPVSGLALEGFDPVSYFLKGAPAMGVPDYEALWGGVIWRFENEGNRTAFLEAPSVYVPRFGGHCAFAAASGHAADGNPRIWAIHRNRLYLFYNYDSRIFWLQDADTFVEHADRAWPEINAQLSR